MRDTKTHAVLRFVDVTAVADARLNTSDNQPIGNTNLLLKETVQKNYATLELNQFLLDGSKAILNNPNDIAFWSKEKSALTTNINSLITINFTNAHTSNGLTLFFVDEYPKKLKIKWYSPYGSILGEEEFEPDGLTYFCKKQVNNYGKIEITFLETVLPKRYIKLQYILFGSDLDWVDEVIKEAYIHEEVDPTSQTLAINTATLSIIDQNNEFDITREVGMWKSVQKTQQIRLSETVDGNVIELGTFYIDRFSFEQNLVKFEMIDAVGLMDKYTFDNGSIYTGKIAGLILEEIFATAGITKYSIEDSIYNTKLRGWLAVQTCREALQMVCIACGALADTSRSDFIKIFVPNREMKSIVTPDRKFLGTNVSLDEYYSGVKIKYAVFDNPVYSILFYDYVEAGRHKITFSSPCRPSTLYAYDAGEPLYPEEDEFGDGLMPESTGDEVPITVGMCNYCIIDVPYPMYLEIGGFTYQTKEYQYEKNVKVVDAGESENIKTIGTLTLIDEKGLENVASKMLDYYTLRKKVKTKFLMEGESVGNWAGIKGDASMVVSFFESNDINLTGGYISTSVCKGYSKDVVNYSYAGNELYADRKGSELI